MILPYVSVNPYLACLGYLSSILKFMLPYLTSLDPMGAHLGSSGEILPYIVELSLPELFVKMYLRRIVNIYSHEVRQPHPSYQLTLQKRLLARGGAYGMPPRCYSHPIIG